MVKIQRQLCHLKTVSSYTIDLGIYRHRKSIFAITWLYFIHSREKNDDKIQKTLWNTYWNTYMTGLTCYRPLTGEELWFRLGTATRTELCKLYATRKWNSTSKILFSCIKCVISLHNKMPYSICMCRLCNP